MKKIRVLLIALLLFMSAFLFACSEKDFGGWSKADDDRGTAEIAPSIDGGGWYSKGDTYTEAGGKIDGGYSGDTIDVPGGEPGTNNERPKAGQLTVCAYNDNDNWNFLQSLLVKGQEKDGLFYDYQNQFKLINNRISLKIKNGNNVKVELLADNKVEYTAYADASGQVYLFNKEVRDKYSVKVYYDNKEEMFEVSDNDELDLSLTNNLNDKIQLMFVVDTTGSMGDEISYLKSEIQDVIERVKKDNDNISVYLSLLFYRDNGDEYVTRYYDFTTDIATQVSRLEKEYASGGGDWEEAVQDAFDLASKAQWNTNASTNILVHVADAPSHDNDVNKWFAAVEKLASQAVRIITVASSGVSGKTEYLFRAQSILTNSYYCYLTNDSGIGNDHTEATVSERPEVEYLNDCLVRLINGIHTGDMKEAVSYKQAN